jgi:hypothetical protein
MVLFIREANMHRTNGRVDQNVMKTNKPKNVASVAMIAILSPFLILAILVSVRTAGVLENDVLLVLLTLSSAVLSGINGFGRRTTRAIPLPAAHSKSAIDSHSQANIRWSVRPSTNA